MADDLILIVEDNAKNLKLTRDVLQFNGFRTLEATTAEDGISLAHHANTECGCYVQSQGRDYDRVEFKEDTIVIRHVHEGPPALH